MKAPLILLIFSALVCAFGFLNPAWSDVLLLGIPCSIASLCLLWRAWRQRRTSDVRVPSIVPTPRQRKPLKQVKKGKQKWVIVDGSNVMHWIDNTPNTQPLFDVLDLLEERGFTAGVMFDANVGHKLFGNYQHDQAFAKLLDLPQDRIMVVPAGVPADPYILSAARDFKAQIVSNDRFRDWVGEFPEVRTPGFLISGWYRDGKLLTSLL